MPARNDQRVPGMELPEVQERERHRVFEDEARGMTARHDAAEDTGFASAGAHFAGRGLISKRPEDIRTNTHSAPLAHFAECAVLAGISE